MFVPKIRQGADPEYGYFDGETTYVIFKDGTLARTYFSSIDAGFKADSLTHEQDESALNRDTITSSKIRPYTLFLGLIKEILGQWK